MTVTEEFWRAIINDFNPVGPASLEEVRRFFVDRSESDPTSSIARRLKLSFQNSIGQPKPHKALLTGHVGSGKSTELLRLGEELAGDFLPIWFDAESSLAEGTVNHFDVLLAMGVAMHTAAQLADLNPPDRLVKRLLKSLARFVRKYEERKGFSLKLNDVIKQVTAGAIIAGAGAVAGPVGAGAAAITVFAAQRLELSVRDELVRTLELPPNRREIMEALNDIIRWVNRECKRPVLIITDGLDKVSAARAKLLFADSAMLTEPACALIYAVPVEFGHRVAAGQAANLFNECKMLPNAPVQMRPATGEAWRADREPNEGGLSIMRQVVARRLEAHGKPLDEVIAPAALTLLAQSSGGVMRELVRYFREAALSAQLLGRDRIDEAMAAQVLAQQRQETARLLNVAHRHALTHVLEQGALGGGQSEAVEDELLRSLHLMSYEDGGRFWFDAHPNVFAFLR